MSIFSVSLSNVELPGWEKNPPFNNPIRRIPHGQQVFYESGICNDAPIPWHDLVIVNARQFGQQMLRLDAQLDSSLPDLFFNRGPFMSRAIEAMRRDITFFVCLNTQVRFKQVLPLEYSSNEKTVSSNVLHFLCFACSWPDCLNSPVPLLSR